jgi:hypothetical protein
MQSIAEFWNVWTRPVEGYGYGLSIDETRERVEFVECTMTLCPTTTMCIRAGGGWWMPIKCAEFKCTMRVGPRSWSVTGSCAS